jgi:hypothetical protein
MNMNWSSSTFLPFLRDNVSGGGAFRYDPLTQRINPHAISRCLTPGNPASLQEACQDVPRQRWSLETDGRIVSISDGTCLTASGTNVVSAACASPVPATQTWWFHPQLRDPAVSMYSLCANENQQCTFSGTREVRYGVPDRYVYRLLTNGTACSNAVFGDPAPGIVKQCHVGLVGMSFCAQENASCSFSGWRQVAYGANGTYVYRRRQNSTPCSNDVFSDPAPGTPKYCFVQ